ncbi:MAG: PDZ domain-containing protein [Isosphaeraceae bacterium]|nr:PDZ domain-containing protein [Isosphaeraceae bacterium]
MRWLMPPRPAPARRFTAALLAVLAGLVLAAPAGAADKPEDQQAKALEQLNKELVEQADRLIVQQQLDEQARANSAAYFLLHAPADNPFGATLSPVDKALRAQLDLPGNHGLVVSSVAADGPAAQVGLQVNDILLELNGAGLSTPGALTEILQSAGDKPVGLHLIREGKPLEIPLKPVFRVTFGPVAPKSQPYFIGVEINTPDDVLRAHVKELPTGQGLIASEVLPDSPAYKSGLKPFDILLECGGKPLSEPNDLVSQVQGSHGKPLSLKVLRGGKARTFDVTPEPRKEAGAQSQSGAEQLSLVYLKQLPGTVDLLGNGRGEARVFRYPANHRVTIDTRFRALADSPHGALDQRLDAINAELARLRDSLDEIKKGLNRDTRSGK